MSKIVEESKRPPTGDFYQQKMKAWQPIMTPTWVISTFLALGLAFVAVGVVFVNYSNQVVEVSLQYDGAGTSGNATSCMLSNDNTERNCTVTIYAPADMVPPIFVYYELHNFYQNHRRYVKSRSDQQLMGTIVANGSLETVCDPKYQLNGQVYNPCGLIAQSMFNDIFTLSDTTAASFGPLDESDIAWPSDVQYKFKNPSNFGSPGYIWLYQSYPDIVSAVASGDGNPLSANYNGGGVQNEHFIVWMRTAALSTFRKLYGRVGSGKAGHIVKTIPAGSPITFNIKSQFRVDEFNGQKAIVLSTTSWLGGKNPFLGYAYIGVGALALVLAVVFILKQLISPRELGDTRFLVWNKQK